jgi:hypothetical protein
MLIIDSFEGFVVQSAGVLQSFGNSRSPKPKLKGYVWW